MLCNFSLRTLGYFQKKKSNFLPMKTLKTGLKSCILMAVWIFFSLQPHHFMDLLSNDLGLQETFSNSKSTVYE